MIDRERDVEDTCAKEVWDRPALATHRLSSDTTLGGGAAGAEDFFADDGTGAPS